MKVKPSQLFSTYSIVARDPETGQLGVAVQTHQMAVGRVVPWLLPGIGALATQSLSNVSFGPIGLEMLSQGVPAPQVVEGLVASDPQANRRQLGVVDAEGKAGAWTGSGCIPDAQHHIGEGYTVHANMMTHDTVVPAMVEAYEQTGGDLANRLIAALQAAQSQGGDIRGMQSAAIKIVSGDRTQPAWASLYDLRVDEHETPVDELARLVRLRRAQLIDDEGYGQLQNDDRGKALELWRQAREEAPELEELPFWQAVTLADAPHNDIAVAVEILTPMLAGEPRRDHWVDLINRLAACGLLERPEAAAELTAALASARRE